MNWVQGIILTMCWCALAVGLIGIGFFVGAWSAYLFDPNCSIPARTAEEYIKIRDGVNAQPPRIIP